MIRTLYLYSNMHVRLYYITDRNKIDVTKAGLYSVKAGVFTERGTAFAGVLFPVTGGVLAGSRQRKTTL